ncbi:MAG: DUF255 domain-containing protein [Arenicellales bacterium]
MNYKINDLLPVFCLLAFAQFSSISLAQTQNASERTPDITKDTAQLAPLSNQLKDHASPYLALHGTDPTAWQAWGPEVLARAKKENKLILLSSGYFSCHWCHVMQRESYKHPDVAKALNNGFIPVKIDRELEPALDKRLMAYAQATLKRGGWPLNVFMSPDGIPVYALLYQPQQPFLALINQLTGLWEGQSERIRKLALAEKKLVTFPDADPKIDANLSIELRTLAVQQILARGDDLEGGFGQSNKFPSAPQLSFLVDSLEFSRNPEVEEFLSLSLDAMAYKGMRDQLSGGFFRYVVDPSWEIPHFEKMLYDNANLASLYLKAGDALERPDYTDIARNTLDFMMREMASDNGALYASFSAIDDKDVEGGYYLWENETLKSVLNEQEYTAFSQKWDSTRADDLEAGNHLRSPKSLKDIAAVLKLSEADISALLGSANQKLITKRLTRVLPTDDKLLAAWNALALSAFANAADTLNDETYRQHAQKIRDFLLNTLWKDQSLTRSLAKGKLLGTAAIEDYAYTAAGLLQWAKLNNQTEDYAAVEAVLTQAWQRFYSHNAWAYADSTLLPPDDGKELLAEDSSASPSAVIIQTTLELQQLGKLKNTTLHTQALSALNRGEAVLRNSAFWYISYIGAMQIAGQP